MQILNDLDTENERNVPVPRFDDLSAELDQFRYRRSCRKSNDFPSRSFPSRLQTYVRYLPGNDDCPDCPLREALQADNVKKGDNVGRNSLTWTK